MQVEGSLEPYIKKQTTSNMTQKVSKMAKFARLSKLFRRKIIEKMSHHNWNFSCDWTKLLRYTWVQITQLPSLLVVMNDPQNDNWSNWPKIAWFPNFSCKRSCRKIVRLQTNLTVLYIMKQSLLLQFVQNSLFGASNAEVNDLSNDICRQNGHS